MMSGATGRVLPLPAGLSELSPGGVLAGVVADVPVQDVSGFDTVVLAGAAYRQATHARAVFLRAVAEAGMRTPGSGETVEHAEHPSEFSCEEIRAAMVWSRTRADNAFWLGHGLFVQLPMLGEAMLAGELDEPRAKAFVDWTAGLSDGHARLVCAELVGMAPSLMVGQVVERIKRMAIALDPAWAQRRYEQAVRGRRVEAWQGPDSTGNVAGRDLPAEQAQAAMGRIDTLARSVKNAGDGRMMDAIRADLFVGMLDGQFCGMTDDEIIAHVLAHPLAYDEVDDEADGEHDDATGESGAGSATGGVATAGGTSEGRRPAAGSAFSERAPGAARSAGASAGGGAGHEAGTPDGRGERPAQATERTTPADGEPRRRRARRRR